jgi:NADPH-dependent 2,4-dienoyl-CoA reductase/sulfur reductase-like enzyme
VITATGRLPADLVVLGIGVAPNSALAAAAGLRLGPKDSIGVDRRQQTSVDGVFAAGDCAESRHLVSGQPVHIALGTVANKQARVAGINMGGGYATFPGVLGTAISKLCSLEVARTGLNEREARDAGFEAVATTITSTTTAGYFPGAEPMTVKLVVERRSGRILGAQIVGGRGAGKRIDAVVVAITAGFVAEDLLQADLAYAPPFSAVWDPVQVAAREALKAI